MIAYPLEALCKDGKWRPCQFMAENDSSWFQGDNSWRKCTIHDGKRSGVALLSYAGQARLKSVTFELRRARFLRVVLQRFVIRESILMSQMPTIATANDSTH